MPAAAVASALTVRVELPPAVTLVWLREVVTPGSAGETETDRLTVPDPPTTAVLTFEVPEAPWARLSEVGLALIAKSAGGGIESVKVTVVVAWLPAWS